MIFLAIAVMQASTQPSPSAERARFAVTVSASTPRVVAVEGRFTLRDATLRMEPGPPTIPDGWASFVRDISLRDSAGRPLALERAGSGTWRAGGAIGQPVVLRYSVVIAHDDTLPNGEPRYARDRTVTEIAFVRPWGVFATGRTLFVLGDWMRDIELTVRAPRGRDIGSSWGVGRDSIVVTIPDSRAAREGMIVTGQLTLAAVRIGGIAVHTALGGAVVTGRRERIDSIAVTSMRRFERVFGSMPKQVRGAPYTSTLLAIGDERNVMFVGGGLSGKDIAMLVAPEGPFSGDVADGAIAHELFHLWNGGAFRYRSPRDSWFSEGVTEFYSIRAMREARFIDDQRYAERLREADRAYRADSGFGRVSIHEAGDAKFRHRGLIYFGGQLVAACLDATLRATSNGRRSLDDVMRAIYERYDADANRFDTEDVLSVIGTVGGPEVAAQVRSWVAGTTPVPTARCLTPSDS
jgi:predicted metalloprotease with PDZ domain